MPADAPVIGLRDRHRPCVPSNARVAYIWALNFTGSYGAMHMPRKEPRVASQKLPESVDALRSLSDAQTLANFAQNLQEGIYITNEAGEIFDVNPAFLEIFGMARLGELKRQRVDDLVDMEVRTRVLAPMERDVWLRT